MGRYAALSFGFRIPQLLVISRSNASVVDAGSFWGDGTFAKCD